MDMEILYILLGWLLGTLSPSIQNRISDGYERDNLKKIIFNDLRDLKKRLAPLPFMVYPQHGKLNAKIFTWIKVNSDKDFSAEIESLAKKDHKEEELIEYLNRKGMEKKKSTYFKKMHLFATDSHLMNFKLIDKDLVEKILEIRFYIEALNEDIDSYRENLKMTFMPGVTENNHRIISQEVDKQNLMIADRSMYIVDKINNILDTRS